MKITQPKAHKYDEKLIEYLKIIDKKEPALYNTLRDIVYGSIITLSAISPNISEVKKKFKEVQIFIDSNVLFNLFDLDFPEACKPIHELFDLLKKFDFKLKVFDFTVDEMIYVLNNYDDEEYMYPVGIKINSIYSNLKNKGWSKEDVREFIQKTEEKIWSFGIEIYPSNLNLNMYTPKKEYIEKIKKYKPLQPYQAEQIYYHDIAAVEEICKIRGRPRREIEKSSAIFLTSDLKLSKFDFLELNHKQNSTICEVIPDRLLTNILWLKNPSLIRDLPLQSIISFHSRGIFINQKVWKRFYFNIKKLTEESKISEKDTSMLFYNGHIQEVLLNFDEADIGRITDRLIIDEVEDAKKNIDAETQKKLEGQKNFFENKIDIEIKKQKDWEDKIKKFKDNKRKKAEQRAISITDTEIGIFLFLVVAFLMLAFWRFPATVRNIIGPAVGILSFAGLRCDLFRIRSKSISKRFNQVYQHQLKELKEVDLEK